MYQEIVKNLNSLWKVDDTDGCFARVEALLATAPRADILARFRDFMPAADVQAWQQSAPEPADPGKGEGSAREPITFSDDEAAAPAPAAAGEDDSDDDVVLVSTTLTNPLVDLPHARHGCAAVPMPARDDADGLCWRGASARAATARSATGPYRTARRGPSIVDIATSRRGGPSATRWLPYRSRRRGALTAAPARGSGCGSNRRASSSATARNRRAGRGTKQHRRVHGKPPRLRVYHAARRHGLLPRQRG